MTEQLRHWTYEEPGSVTEDLEQGDLLAPTNELKGVFRDVHPHFNNPKYLGFLVVTQSCDLVQRDGQSCEVRYINVAAIRLLEHVLLRLLDSVCEPLIPGVYLEEGKGKAENLIGRIINQNEQSLGLFYLHPDPSVGISEPAVALLRISVAVRSDHYGILQKSRMGRLAKEFRGKLGWLVGNMYSRIGTEDWSEPHGRREQQKALVKQILEPGSEDNRPRWIPRRQKKAAEQAGVNIRALTRATIVEALSQHKPPARSDVAAEAAREVLRNLVLPMLLTSLDRMPMPSTALLGSDWFRFFAREHGADNVGWLTLPEDVRSQSDTLIARFYTRLRNDPVFAASLK